MDTSLTPEMHAKMDAFLDKYNADRREDAAVRMALRASIQRNPLYREDLDPDERRQLKAFWAAELIGRRAQYIKPVSDSDYEADVLLLKHTMNQRFPGRFRGPEEAGGGVGTGFRISHAQKSLAVFLKHLWCIHRDTVPPPPQCPVDRMILAEAMAPLALRSWTKVDSIDHHRRQIACLRKQSEAAGVPLAHWELKHFPGKQK